MYLLFSIFYRTRKRITITGLGRFYHSSVAFVNKNSTYFFSFTNTYIYKSYHMYNWDRVFDIDRGFNVNRNTYFILCDVTNGHRDTVARTPGARNNKDYWKGLRIFFSVEFIKATTDSSQHRWYTETTMTTRTIIV